MAPEIPTVRERGYPIGVASVGSAEGGVSEDTLEGAKMIQQQQQQVIEEIGVRGEEPAYRNGWEDGRFGPTRLFVENPSLAGWAAHHERLAYYRGHRDGRRVRAMLSHTDQRA